MKIAQAITVQATINAPISSVWDCWNNPEHITGWAFASEDWEAPAAENDLRIGGKFRTAMAAKDKSAGFDFIGTYTALKPNELIEYDMDDGRHVKVEFKENAQRRQDFRNFRSRQRISAGNAALRLAGNPGQF